jgi:hypothetical protein
MALERDETRQRIQEILAEHDTAANVVLSHGDVDHYRWIPHVLGELSVQHIWQGGAPDTYGSDGFPQWIATQEARGAMIHRDFPVHWHNDGQPLGDELSCGLASTFVLTVNSGAGGSTNTDSLVLMIEYEDFTAIFPGYAVGITEELAEESFRGASKPACSRRPTMVLRPSRATAPCGPRQHRQLWSSTARAAGTAIQHVRQPKSISPSLSRHPTTRPIAIGPPTTLSGRSRIASLRSTPRTSSARSWSARTVVLR